MSDSSKPLRVGVVGYGLAGRVFHAPFVSAVPGLLLAAIVSSRTEQIHEAWPGVAVLSSVEEAFESPELDLLVIASPNHTHVAFTRRALESGKHVVVDKPVASSSAEVAGLAELASRKGLIFAPFHNRRWDGDFLTVRRLLQGGTLGRLVSFESHFDRFRPQVREATWKERADDSNGLLMDLGPHLVDQALALFGPPESLVASVRRDREGSEIDDGFDLWLQYPSFHVLLRSTLIAAEPSPRFLVHGTRGSYRKLGVDPQEPVLVAGAKVPRLGEETLWLREEPASWGELAVAHDASQPDALDRTRLETMPGDYRGFYSNVRDVIRGDAALQVTPEDARRTLLLLELARESSQKGKQIVVDLH